MYKGWSIVLGQSLESKLNAEAAEGITILSYETWYSNFKEDRLNTIHYIQRKINLPAAFPIWVFWLNPAVTEMQRIIRIQLTSGIYIWWRCLEVYITLTLGKQPSERACLISEKVAVMVDWLATIAAAIAMTYTGQYIVSANIINWHLSVTNYNEYAPRHCENVFKI